MEYRLIQTGHLEKPLPGLMNLKISEVVLVCITDSWVRIWYQQHESQPALGWDPWISVHGSAIQVSGGESVQSIDAGGITAASRGWTEI